MLLTQFLLYISLVIESWAKNLPVTFDSREQWPDCQTISEVRTLDPHCSRSNWAFALASTMSDRICIQFNRQVVLSPYNLRACCSDCSDSPCGSHEYFIRMGSLYSNGNLYRR